MCESEILKKLEENHLKSACSDPDCWCHDEEYLTNRMEEKASNPS